MALGNSNSSAQSRGKNKAIVVIRRKEQVSAAGFTAFQGSALQSSDACSLDNSNVNITYYHDGSGVLPQVGDKVYTRKRLNTRFLVDNDKHFKVGPDRGRYFNVNYRSGVVSNVSAC
tara:strand:+ start:494 stop:844 length:351 start_codon:yes stop_codon:yes gene_type:complete